MHSLVSSQNGSFVVYFEFRMRLFVFSAAAFLTFIPPSFETLVLHFPQVPVVLLLIFFLIFLQCFLSYYLGYSLIADPKLADFISHISFDHKWGWGYPNPLAYLFIDDKPPWFIVMNLFELSVILYCWGGGR